MARLRFFLLCFFGSLSLSAQQNLQKGEVTVTLFSESGHPLENATAELLRATDSVLVKTALTDKEGKALWTALPYGTYLLRVSMVQYKTLTGKAFTLGEARLQLPSITLAGSTSAQMQGVTVTARKPFIQKLSDRIVVNVENSSVNAGSSAMDVLERSPGVSVDQNDVIGLRGRQGVIIMIDGKPSPMTGADLANYLRGLPSNAIERIEIITNPSARYDAAGNSGIIDIRMKKDQRLGTNGTWTAGYGQGVYPKANTGATFNYRNKKVNLFGNYNYAYRQLLNHLVLNRNFFNNGTFMGADDKDNYSTFRINGHSARFGADYFWGKKTILGFVVTTNFSTFDRDNRNHSVERNAAYEPYSTFQTHATNNDHNNNYVANLNVKHSFDSTGRELTADVDLGRFGSRALSRTASRFYNLNGTRKKPDEILDGDQDGALTLRTAKADYVHPLGRGRKFEAGLKTSQVTSDNDVQFLDMSTGIPVNDVNKTNQFRYRENNHAVYLNGSKEFRKFSLQVGLRGEQTQVTTHQLSGDVHWDSSYFQLFPSAFFNYKVKENQTLGVSVSRRIDRPGYSQLNPFLFLIDATTYATGNPGLLPQLTWSYELSYTLKSLNFTLGYSHTSKPMNVVIARFRDAFPSIPADDNVTVQVPVNLTASDYYGLTVSAPVRISKWWNMINNANVYYNHFNGNLGGSSLNSGGPAARLSTNNNFTFAKGWSAELNAQYSSAGRYAYSFGRAQWGVSTGVQKNVLKSKGTLRLNVTDIFWTNLPRATITFPGRYVENWHAYRDSRVANLSFTYRFGNNKVQAARRRTTASEEERRRAGGN